MTRDQELVCADVVSRLQTIKRMLRQAELEDLRDKVEAVSLEIFSAAVESRYARES